MCALSSGENDPPNDQQHQAQQEQQQPQAKRARVAQQRPPPAARRPCAPRPGLFAAAAGCPSTGVHVFGGLEARQSTVKATADDAWLSEGGPMRQEPDFSRVITKPADLAASARVQRVAPISMRGGGNSVGDEDADGSEGGEGRGDRDGGGAWRMHEARHQLSCGLVGHSAALYKGRVYIFGGQLDERAADYARSSDAPTGASVCCGALRGYAVTRQGLQMPGGAEQLPVVSDTVPQNGEPPGPRMHHSVAVDEEGGTMYLYGGVTFTRASGQRRPADAKAGLVHAYRFATGTWQRLATEGARGLLGGGDYPVSTTLLALAFHKGALWALPQLPPPSAGALPSRARAAGYRLHRLDPLSRRWTVVATQGAGPPPRCESAAALLADCGRLVVFGGRALAQPRGLLSDAYCLDLESDPPAWTQLQPWLTCTQHADSGRRHAQQAAGGGGGGGMLAVAGHGGAALGGRAVFVGGCRRHDLQEPEAVVQVLERAVVPPTPDAAGASEASKARQHCRQQLAKMLRQAGGGGAQARWCGSGRLGKRDGRGAMSAEGVLLVPSGGGTPVRLPAVLLALHSRLFLDMHQSGMFDSDGGDGGGVIGGAAPAHAAQVPVEGVGAGELRLLCRWLAGLACLDALPLADLARVHLAADRLIMEGLMAESLGLLLSARPGDHAGAAALLRLAAELSHRPGLQEVGDRAEQLLADAATPHNAAQTMELAVACGRAALRAACLVWLNSTTKGRLLWHADTVVAVTEQHCLSANAGAQGAAEGKAAAGGAETAGSGSSVGSGGKIVAAAARQLPVIEMLERDLLAEQQPAGLKQLGSYVAAAERLRLVRLRDGLLQAVAGQWSALATGQPQLLRALNEQHPAFMADAARRAGSGRSHNGAEEAAHEPVFDDVDALFD
ncbi:hypothetical protein MNEG_2475 [Monoraphidium neglectum]|uniref:Uncharacterized protein n=1 Tax=Monoraphidium neglectum TaxID=145388 RepID=A0A0D2NL52_9CHLO|nr:hypothetical protein MNEG_2475 [Monoraphidium neglectum]KIZ05481.1 hypothetical protein MNEG_2475 [Monoraphidium neglectum]|eukprot:XP_013904500.1 hypothetical protein MNEG_2475 [Monoraphidium neglectum]